MNRHVKIALAVEAIQCHQWRLATHILCQGILTIEAQIRDLPLGHRIMSSNGMDEVPTLPSSIESIKHVPLQVVYIPPICKENTVNPTIASVNHNNVFALYRYAFVPCPASDSMEIDMGVMMDSSVEMETYHTSNAYYELSVVMIYNLALTYHLTGQRDENSYVLGKALRLYNIASGMLTNISGDVSVAAVEKIKMLHLAIYSNMGNIYASFYYHKELQMCATRMKQILELNTMHIASCQLYFINGKVEDSACVDSQHPIQHQNSHSSHLVSSSSASSSPASHMGLDDVIPATPSFDGHCQFFLLSLICFYAHC
jgi:hypothetical protein